jgi:hypothetical protein
VPIRIEYTEAIDYIANFEVFTSIDIHILVLLLLYRVVLYVFSREHTVCMFTVEDGSNTFPRNVFTHIPAYSIL